MKNLHQILTTLLLLILPIYSDEPKAINKLDVKIAEVDFKDVSLEEAVGYISQQLRQAETKDQATIGVSLRPPSKTEAKRNESEAAGALAIKEDDDALRITFTAKDITVKLLLQEIGRQTKVNIYLIDDEFILSSNKVLKVYEVPE